MNATASIVYLICTARLGFNGHPPLGVNATYFDCSAVCLNPETAFQWAPTLGGECYAEVVREKDAFCTGVFQWAPTLGGECYKGAKEGSGMRERKVSMGTHPWG